MNPDLGVVGWIADWALPTSRKYKRIWLSDRDIALMFLKEL